MDTSPPKKVPIRDIIVGTVILAVCATIAVVVAISVYHHEIMGRM